MPATGTGTADPDFFIDQGVIAYGKRGRQLLSAFYELIKGTLPAIAIAFDEKDADADSYLARGEEVAVGAYIQFCISCLYEPARAHYGVNQGSLFADALFAKCYRGKLPGDELFQLYLDYPLFPEDRKRQGQTKPGRLPGGRIFQFVYDVLGHPDIRPMIVLNPTVGQLMLDGKAVLEATDPAQTANELVRSFFPRLTERLERLGEQKPLS